MKSNDFDYVEDIERKLRELAEKMTKGKKIEIKVRDKKVTVEQLNRVSFRIRNDVMDIRKGEEIVLPSGEKRKVGGTFREGDRFDKFWIYFRIIQR